MSALDSPITPGGVVVVTRLNWLSLLEVLTKPDNQTKLNNINVSNVSESGSDVNTSK